MHRADCPNFVNIPPEEKKHVLGVRLGSKTDVSYSYITEIQILLVLRSGMLFWMSKVLTEVKVPVKNL
ncbi:hypothetical protein AN396_14165 [Candidatus Epulonipiscium fishelsonii]|uniref:Uncharacterized protein n=1 Tax=Candidatus Epulonipiscium fishelsonii TaxID=77094 RepID=A0ACC8XGJ4_9FIRM|nr:hypothetical protein AN396_14165 [Epulopiscium sp. SCG-B11WGA-EpuloA1]